jgi:hypothetical protein
VVAQVAVQLHARSIRRAGCMTRESGPMNHLGPFGDVLVINDNCLWTNDSSRNKNAGLDHIKQEMLGES